MKRCTQCCIISGSHTLIFIFVVCMFIGESVLVRCSNMSNSSDNIDKHNHTNGRRRTSCTETKRNEKDFSNAHRNSYERRLKQKQMTIGTHMWMRKREQDTRCESYMCSKMFAICMYAYSEMCLIARHSNYDVV